MSEQNSSREVPNAERNRAGIEDISADIAVVELDVSRRPDEVDRELGVLAEDLRRARQLRGEQLQPSGWPVVISLVGVDPVSDDQCRAVRGRLAEIAADAADGPAFGDIDLIVLPRSEVAAAASAAVQRYRRRRALVPRRLRSVVCGVAASIAALLIFAAAIFVTRSAWLLSPLAARVEDYREREGATAAARLQEPLQGRIATLADILADPSFPSLSERRQRYVRDRLTELSAYRDYTARLGRIASPLEAGTEQELDDIERQLTKDLAVPAAYVAVWTTTEAALRREQALATARRMRDNSRTAAEWYRRLARQAQQLMAGPAPDGAELRWSQWKEQVAGLVAESNSPPMRIDSRAEHAAVMALPTVAQARADWERGQRRLNALVQMTEALGLVPDRGEPPLRLSPEMTVERAAEVAARLNQEFPGWRDWSPARWPESTVSALRPALLALRDAVLEAGRRDLARRVAPAASRGALTPAQWRAAAAEFTADPALRDWRDLAAATTRWLDPDAPDPIAALNAFLARDRFDTELRSVRLALPESLPDGPWAPGGDFLIRAQTGAAPPRSLAFRSTGGFNFTAESDRTLTVIPGDAIWAELPIRDRAGNAAVLSWWANGIRTGAYQFDRLALPPRLHRPDQKIEDGRLLTGASLALVPEHGWPRLPDLLPAIR